ncbi:hypothetical protein KWH75_15290, partial [Morganella morganii]|uniref:hypothetical protein n=1 Tax=Morganella morganii TaxID=582 RepID=UPI0021D0174A
TYLRPSADDGQSAFIFNKPRTLRLHRAHFTETSVINGPSPHAGVNAGGVQYMSYLYLAIKVEQDNDKDKPSLPVVLFRPVISDTENIGIGYIFQ